MINLEKEMQEIETIQSMLAKPLRDAIEKFGQDRVVDAFHLLINAMEYHKEKV